MTYIDVYTSRQFLKLLIMEKINLTPRENVECAFQCNHCHNLAANPVSTPCGHLFCKSCIYSWSQFIGHVIFPCPKCGAASVYEYMVPLYGRGVDSPTTSVARVVKNNIVHNMGCCSIPQGIWRDLILEAIASVRSEEGNLINLCRAEFLAQHPEFRWKLIEDIFLSMNHHLQKNLQLDNCQWRSDYLLLVCILESCIMFEEMRGVPYQSRGNVAMVLDVLEDVELEQWESLQKNNEYFVTLHEEQER